MSAIMADMKTKPAAKKSARHAASAPVAPRRVFTVRELNRQPQSVLSAALKLGGVHVQARSGERFILKPDPVPQPETNSREEFHHRLKEMHARMSAEGSDGFTAEGWETFSKIIAGET